MYVAHLNMSPCDNVGSSHVTHCDTLWMSHVTHMNESYDTNNWVTSQLWVNVHHTSKKKKIFEWWHVVFSWGAFDRSSDMRELKLICANSNWYARTQTELCYVAMRDDSLMCVMSMIHVCDVNNSCVGYDSLYVWHDPFTCLTWQPTTNGVSLNLNLQSQSNWSLFNGTWKKRRRELDNRLRFEIGETKLHTQQAELKRDLLD